MLTTQLEHLAVIVPHDRKHLHVHHFQTAVTRTDKLAHHRDIVFHACCYIEFIFEKAMPNEVVGHEVAEMMVCGSKFGEGETVQHLDDLEL